MDLDEEDCNYRPNQLVLWRKQELHVLPAEPKSRSAMGKNAGDAVQRVDCDNGPEHHFKIKFYGRVEQPEYVAVQWSCTRTAGGFTCSELSGVAPPPPPP